MSSRDIENFQRLNALIQCHLPPDLAAWWTAGSDKFKRGEAKSLCSALGLRGAGIRQLKNLELMRRRNILLYFASKYCRSYQMESLNSRCETLADMIRRYPRSKSENPLLKPIFDLGIYIPPSPNRLLEIIQDFDKYRHFSSKKPKG